MTELLNKMKVFQLRFGAYKSSLNRCDMFVTNVFDESTKQSSVTQSEQLGVECSTTPTTVIVEESSIVQPDILTLMTPPHSISPSQHQQSFVLDDTNKDTFNPKAKKTLDFTDAHSENMFVCIHYKYYFIFKFITFNHCTTLSYHLLPCITNNVFISSILQKFEAKRNPSR